MRKERENSIDGKTNQERDNKTCEREKSVKESEVGFECSVKH